MIATRLSKFFFLAKDCPPLQLLYTKYVAGEGRGGGVLRLDNHQEKVCELQPLSRAGGGDDLGAFGLSLLARLGVCRDVMR